jgi:hypothetical protein
MPEENYDFKVSRGIFFTLNNVFAQTYIYILLFKTHGLLALTIER